MKSIYKIVIKLILLLILSACNKESEFSNYAIEIPDSCEATNIPYGAPIVKIKFTVTENGVINNKSISQTSGYKNIDDVALKNIDTCKYTPLIVNSKPQASLVERTYTWTQNIAK
jgi:TonB family protein